MVASSKSKMKVQVGWGGFDSMREQPLLADHYLGLFSSICLIWQYRNAASHPLASKVHVSDLLCRHAKAWAFSRAGRDQNLGSGQGRVGHSE